MIILKKLKASYFQLVSIYTDKIQCLCVCLFHSGDFIFKVIYNFPNLIELAFGSVSGVSKLVSNVFFALTPPRLLVVEK